MHSLPRVALPAACLPSCQQLLHLSQDPSHQSASPSPARLTTRLPAGMSLHLERMILLPSHSSTPAGHTLVPGLGATHPSPLNTLSSPRLGWSTGRTAGRTPGRPAGSPSPSLRPTPAAPSTSASTSRCQQGLQPSPQPPGTGGAVALQQLPQAAQTPGGGSPVPHTPASSSAHVPGQRAHQPHVLWSAASSMPQGRTCSRMRPDMGPTPGPVASGPASAGAAPCWAHVHACLGSMMHAEWCSRRGSCCPPWRSAGPALYGTCRLPRGWSALQMSRAAMTLCCTLKPSAVRVCMTIQYRALHGPVTAADCVVRHKHMDQLKQLP